MDEKDKFALKIVGILVIAVIILLVIYYTDKSNDKPDIKILSDSPQYINTTHGTLVFVATDNTPDIECHVELNSVITNIIQVTSGVQAEVPMTLEQGENNIRIKAIDQAGNEAWSDIYVIHVDSDPPDIIIIDFRAAQ